MELQNQERIRAAAAAAIDHSHNHNHNQPSSPGIPLRLGKNVHREIVPPKEDSPSPQTSRSYKDGKYTQLLMEKEELLRMYSPHDAPVIGIDNKIKKEIRNFTKD